LDFGFWRLELEIGYYKNGVINMPGFGDFGSGKNKKKKSKGEMAKTAMKSSTGSSWVLPVPEVIKKKKDQNW